MPEAHDTQVTHTYHIHYPRHEPRADDPHYTLFNAYRKAHVATAVCAVGARGPKFLADCKGGLQLHHKIIEFAMQNEVDLETFAKDFVGVTTQDELMAWAESDPNFQWLCEFHHIGHAGVHVMSASDWSNGWYIPGLAS